MSLAAHCISPKSEGNTAKLLPHDIIAILGARNLSNYYELRRKILAVKQIKVHEDWKQNSMSFDADVAILTLEEEVRVTKQIKPICIWKNVAFLDKGVVVGWSRSNERFNSMLSQIILPIHPNEKCFLPGSELSKVSSARTFCGGDIKVNSDDTCLGDDGNGFLIIHENAYYLRGISSLALTNRETCASMHYAIYTDIFLFKNWIEESLMTSEDGENSSVDKNKKTYSVSLRTTNKPSLELKVKKDSDSRMSMVNMKGKMFIIR